MSRTERARRRRSTSTIDRIIVFIVTTNLLGITCGKFSETDKSLEGSVLSRSLRLMSRNDNSTKETSRGQFSEKQRGSKPNSTEGLDYQSSSEDQNKESASRRSPALVDCSRGSCLCNYLGTYPFCFAPQGCYFCSPLEECRLPKSKNGAGECICGSKVCKANEMCSQSKNQEKVCEEMWPDRKASHCDELSCRKFNKYGICVVVGAANSKVDARNLNVQCVCGYGSIGKFPRCCDPFKDCMSSPPKCALGSSEEGKEVGVMGTCMAPYSTHHSNGSLICEYGGHYPYCHKPLYCKQCTKYEACSSAEKACLCGKIKCPEWSQCEVDVESGSPECRCLHGGRVKSNKCSPPDQCKDLSCYQHNFYSRCLFVKGRMACSCQRGAEGMFPDCCAQFASCQEYPYKCKYNGIFPNCEPPPWIKCDTDKTFNNELMCVCLEGGKFPDCHLPRQCYRCSRIEECVVGGDSGYFCSCGGSAQPCSKGKICIWKDGKATCEKYPSTCLEIKCKLLDENSECVKGSRVSCKCRSGMKGKFPYCAVTDGSSSDTCPCGGKCKWREVCEKDECVCKYGSLKNGICEQPEECENMWCGFNAYCQSGESDGEPKCKCINPKDSWPECSSPCKPFRHCGVDAFCTVKNQYLNPDIDTVTCRCKNGGSMPLCKNPTECAKEKCADGLCTTLTGTKRCICNAYPNENWMDAGEMGNCKRYVCTEKNDKQCIKKRSHCEPDKNDISNPVCICDGKTSTCKVEQCKCPEIDTKCVRSKRDYICVCKNQAPGVPCGGDSGGPCPRHLASICGKNSICSLIGNSNKPLCICLFGGVPPNCKAGSSELPSGNCIKCKVWEECSNDECVCAHGDKINGVCPAPKQCEDHVWCGYYAHCDADDHGEPVCVCNNKDDEFPKCKKPSICKNINCGREGYCAARYRYQDTRIDQPVCRCLNHELDFPNCKGTAVCKPKCQENEICIRLADGKAGFCYCRTTPEIFDPDLAGSELVECKTFPCTDSAWEKCASQGARCVTDGSGEGQCICNHGGEYPNCEQAKCECSEGLTCIKKDFDALCKCEDGHDPPCPTRCTPELEKACGSNAICILDNEHQKPTCVCVGEGKPPNCKGSGGDGSNDCNCNKREVCKDDMCVCRWGERKDGSCPDNPACTFLVVKQCRENNAHCDPDSSPSKQNCVCNNDGTYPRCNEFDCELCGKMKCIKNDKLSFCICDAEDCEGIGTICDPVLHKLMCGENSICRIKESDNTVFCGCEEGDSESKPPKCKGGKGGDHEPHENASPSCKNCDRCTVWEKCEDDSCECKSGKRKDDGNCEMSSECKDKFCGFYSYCDDETGDCECYNEKDKYPKCSKPEICETTGLFCDPAKGFCDAAHHLSDSSKDVAVCRCFNGAENWDMCTDPKECGSHKCPKDSECTVVEGLAACYCKTSPGIGELIFGLPGDCKTYPCDSKKCKKGAFCKPSSSDPSTGVCKCKEGGEPPCKDKDDSDGQIGDCKGGSVLKSSSRHVFFQRDPIKFEYCGCEDYGDSFPCGSKACSAIERKNCGMHAVCTKPEGGIIHCRCKYGGEVPNCLDPCDVMKCDGDPKETVCKLDKYMDPKCECRFGGNYPKGRCLPFKYSKRKCGDWSFINKSGNCQCKYGGQPKDCYPPCSNIWRRDNCLEMDCAMDRRKDQPRCICYNGCGLWPNCFKFEKDREQECKGPNKFDFDKK